MPAFDIDAAKKAGYSDAEIADFLAKKNNFNVDAARKAGYNDSEIVSHLSGANNQPAQEQPKPEATALDRANAVATGFNRGVIRTIGLPADTIQNVIDLGKAGVGTIANLAGRPDLAPTVYSDRSNIFGSGDYLEAKMRQAGKIGAAQITPTGPIDKTAQILHGVGMGVGSTVVGGRVPLRGAMIAEAPATLGAELRNATVGGLAGGAQTAAAVNGASPAAATTAGMLPQLAATSMPSLARLAVRGDEAGRQNMLQRLSDFKNAGIENPSVGLASDNKLLQGVENILASTPGAVGRFQAARDQIVSGMAGKAAQARDAASSRYGADVSGRLIQEDLQNRLPDSIDTGYNFLNNKLLSMLAADGEYQIPNTLNALSRVTSVNPNAPATTGSLVQPRIKALRDNLMADTTTTVPGPMVYDRQPATKGLPLSAIKEIRTSIGKEARSTAIKGTPEQADYKQVYGGLSKDMRGAARSADMDQGPQPNNMGPAERALDRSNKLYSAGMNRIDTVEPFAKKDAPEQAYNALIQSGKENVSTLRAVKKSIGDDARASTAATYIDRLGRANPSNQNDLGDVWSPEKFLTNWNTLNPKARQEIFSGFNGSDKVASQMDDIARAAAMLRDSSKVWANPSGTAEHLSAKALLGGTAAALFLNPKAAAVAGLGIGGINLTARMMTNPKVVDWLAQSTKIPQSQAVAHINRLVQMANDSKDPAFKKDVKDFVDSLAE